MGDDINYWRCGGCDGTGVDWYGGRCHECSGTGNAMYKGDYPGLDRRKSRLLKWLRQAGTLLLVTVLIEAGIYGIARSHELEFPVAIGVFQLGGVTAGAGNLDKSEVPLVLVDELPLTREEIARAETPIHYSLRILGYCIVLGCVLARLVRG